MAITAGSDILAADFISSSAGAGSSGQVAKLNGSGVLDNSFYGFMTSGLIQRSFISQSFGGTGIDGALTVSSGTTTIDLGGAQYFVKNYTSISITGTGKVVFTNPHANGTIICLKSQGNVTLTSSQAPMLDASGMGSSQSNMGVGTVANSNFGNGGSGGGTTPTGGGPASAAITFPVNLAGKLIRITPGTSGGAGAGASSAAGSAAGGSPGRGGGALIIECAGAWNFTTANGISVAGLNATAGQNGPTDVGGGGGGGGGSGGMFLGLYNTLTANTGSVNINGGNGGLGGDRGGNNNGFVSAGGGGGAGGSCLNAGGQGGNAAGTSTGNATSGLNGSGTGAGTGASGGNSNGSQGASKSPGGGGGGGGGGTSLITQNTEFV